LARAKGLGERLGLRHELKRIPTWVLAVIYSLALVLGPQVRRDGAPAWGSAWTWLLVLLLVPVLAAAVAVASGLVMRGSRAKVQGALTGFKPFLWRWAGIFLCWMPLWLATYPGFFAYDAAVEMAQVESGAIGYAQPPLHVLLLGHGVRFLHRLLGGWNAAIAVYLLIQALAIAASFAWVLGRLAAWGVPRWAVRTGWAYYALFPTVAMFALCSTKDGLASAALTVFVVLLVDIAKGRAGWSIGAAAALSATFVLLLRLNAVYVLVPVAVWALIVSRGRRPVVAVAVVSPIVLCLFATSFLYPRVLHFAPPLPVSSLSVPLQQLARVYNMEGDQLSAEDRQTIEKWWATPEGVGEGLGSYAPVNSDMIWPGLNNPRLETHTKEFWKDWLRIGLRYPAVYLDATMANTYEAWLPGAPITGYSLGVHPRGVYSTKVTSYFAFDTEYPGVMHSPSVLPPVQDFYRAISKSWTVARAPVISWLLTPGLYLWLAIFVFALAVRRGSPGRAMALPVGLLVLLSLTFFAGPVQLVRYFLHLYFAFPLLLAFLARPAAFAGASAGIAVTDEPAATGSVLPDPGAQSEPAAANS
jgi:hypothetical protein